MNIKETRQSLYERQLWIREKIASEADEIAHLCKGEIKRGKVVSDKWDQPDLYSRRIRTCMAKMDKHIAELNCNIGADEMLQQLEVEND
jgi:hypothetical protein